MSSKKCGKRQRNGLGELHFSFLEGDLKNEQCEGARWPRM